MKKYEELKQQLTQIRDNDYNLPNGANVDGIIADMLGFIGHTDAELRDKLIYKTFVQWAEVKGIISTDKMKQILDICLSDAHLFYSIGESGTDSVFTRSFSSLIISVAFCVHDENPFLTANDIQSIKETVLRYIALEKDFRGYVDGKGWAHAVAHIADALINIAGCSVDNKLCIGREGFLEILQAVKTLACNNQHIYSAEEDERLAITPFVGAVYLNILTAKELMDWIDSFNMSDNEWWKGTVPGDYYLHVNRKNFMRSLYFKLLPHSGYEEVCKHMLGFLAEEK